jgi:DNA-binding transcriptional LysR family regulator
LCGDEAKSVQRTANVPDIRRGEFEAIVLDVRAADVGGIHLIYSPDRSPPAKVKVMIDFLVAAFNPRSPWAMQ